MARRDLAMRAAGTPLDRRDPDIIHGFDSAAIAMDIDAQKRAAAARALEMVKPGMSVEVDQAFAPQVPVGKR